MPIFEYVCVDCGLPFEELVYNTNKEVEVFCPSCQSQNVTKQISSFASRFIGGNSYSYGSTSSSGCSTGSV